MAPETRKTRIEHSNVTCTGRTVVGSFSRCIDSSYRANMHENAFNRNLYLTWAAPMYARASKQTQLAVLSGSPATMLGP